MVTYEITDGVVLLTMLGSFDAEDMIVAVNGAKSDPAYTDSMAFVLDGTEADRAVFDADAIRQLASFTSADEARRGRPVAVVPTPGLANFWLTQMFQLHTGAVRHLEIFESVGDALFWARALAMSEPAARRPIPPAPA